MNYFRCYLLTAEAHIARVTILKCADAADAERQCRAVVAAGARYASAEVWDGTRRLYRYPENSEAPVRAQIEQERREQVLAEPVRVAHLRERHLEQAAHSPLHAVARPHHRAPKSS